jgi:CRISPR/Cas system-associated endonuclease Cas1
MEIVKIMCGNCMITQKKEPDYFGMKAEVVNGILTMENGEKYDLTEYYDDVNQPPKDQVEYGDEIRSREDIVNAGINYTKEFYTTISEYKYNLIRQMSNIIKSQINCGEDDMARTFEDEERLPVTKEILIARIQQFYDHMKKHHNYIVEDRIVAESEEGHELDWPQERVFIDLIDDFSTHFEDVLSDRYL